MLPTNHIQSGNQYGNEFLIQWYNTNLTDARLEFTIDISCVDDHLNLTNDQLTKKVRSLLTKNINGFRVNGENCKTKLIKRIQCRLHSRQTIICSLKLPVHTKIDELLIRSKLINNEEIQSAILI